MEIKTGRKQNFKNIALNILAFGVQFLIGFYISPKIVGQVGTAAYGFIGLANDFVSYAAILASVFNSVAARFIAKAYYESDYLSANKYFNSLIVANIGISVFLGVLIIVIIPNLEKMISIPSDIIFDVKVTFALIFVSYIVTLLTMVFTTSTFVSNRTDVQGIRNIILSIIRLAIIVVFLNFISVKLYWIALATLIASVITAIMNIGLTKKLTPELHISLTNAKKTYAFELAKAGSWMAITSISTILLRGLDLTIANIMIGDYEMGLLSIARTMPNYVSSVIGTIAPVFTPVFIIFFSKTDIDGLVDNVKKTIRLMAILLFVPISAFVIYSYDFYSLWQVSLNTNELSIVTVLSILTVIQSYFEATTSTMAQISVVVNKLKLPVIINLACGIASFVAEIIMIKVFNLGLYAIVISTTFIMTARYVLFNSIYAAWCLKQRKRCFFGTVFKTWLSVPFLLVIMHFIRMIVPVNSWLTLVVSLSICCVLGYLFIIVVLGKEYVSIILNKFGISK